MWHIALIKCLVLLNYYGTKTSFKETARALKCQVTVCYHYLTMIVLSLESLGPVLLIETLAQALRQVYRRKEGCSIPPVPVKRRQTQHRNTEKHFNLAVETEEMRMTCVCLGSLPPRNQSSTYLQSLLGAVLAV